MSRSPGALQSQTVVVVGGSEGIGAAVAERAHAAGANVFAISRTGRAPAGLPGLVANVDNAAQLEQAFQAAGTIDHLVYTAGARVGSPELALLEVGVLDQLFASKLYGAITAVRVALPYLAERASVTLTSGQVARKYGKGSLLKGSVNAAVEAAAVHLAKELAPVRVNAVSPGVADTNTWGPPSSEQRAATLARVSASLPVGRVARVEEIAEAYLFLMTNGFATGAVIDVNGGGLL